MDHLSMKAREACLWPTSCTLVALGYKGYEWGLKLGCLDSEMHSVGKKGWECGLGILTLWDAASPVSM